MLLFNDSQYLIAKVLSLALHKEYPRIRQDGIHIALLHGLVRCRAQLTFFGCFSQ